MRRAVIIISICTIFAFALRGANEGITKEENPISEVRILNGGPYYEFYDTCDITVNRDGSIFTFTSKLEGLEDCSITFTGYQHENKEYPDFISYWEDFCRLTTDIIAPAEPLSKPPDSGQYLYYEILFIDGTSYYYDSNSYDDSIRANYYDVFYNHSTMSEIIDHAIEESYENGRIKRYNQLGDLNLQPLEAFTYYNKSVDGMGTNVITFSSDLSVTYEYFIVEEMSDPGTPRVTHTEQITSDQWDVLLNNKDLMLAYAVARKKGVTNSQEIKSYITFIAQDGEFSINYEIDPLSFVFFKSSIEGLLYSAGIKDASYDAYAMWHYQFTYDNYDISGMSPLKDLYSISLSPYYRSELFGSIVSYYIDADLNFEITTDQIVTKGVITEKQWDDLICSKGMLIAQQEQSRRSGARDMIMGTLVLKSKDDTLLYVCDPDEAPTKYVILEIEKLAQECGMIELHQQAIYEYTTPIDPMLMKDEHMVNNWVYFLYPQEEPLFTNGYSLFRRREDGTGLTRLTGNLCDEYTVLGDCVYYAGYTADRQHGMLYVIKPDGEPLLLADELCGHQIVDNHIYYAHSFDTIGVGIEGHALHRIDLDGGNHMIVAYETNGPGISSGYMGEIKDGYVYYKNFRIKLGEPADGSEEVQVIAPLDSDNDDGWIYYATNRLYKARPNGSEQTVLAGDEDSWIYISKVDDKWVYYHDEWPPTYHAYYKIRKDGSEKIEVSKEEFHDY